MEEMKPLDGNQVMTPKEAKKVLKEHDYKVQNGKVDAFVSLQNINKVYPNGVQAVYSFNLDINQHDFIVLVGPSGCGKSTTLRMVAGLEDITSGYLYIDKVLSNYLPSKSRDISMVFQSYALYPQMTVYDNIAFPLRVRKYHSPKVDRKALGLSQAITALDNEELASIVVDAFDKALSFGKPFEYLSTALDICDDASKNIIGLNITRTNKEKAKDFILNGKEQFKANFQSQLDQEITKVSVNGITLNDKFQYLNNGELVYEDQKLTEEEIRRKVFDAAKVLDLGPYLDRRPNELSGGQMQRVALGRAIVRNAKVFLMDEPLSNLDAKLRVTMRSEIVRLHEAIGATSIYVTHDQTEAMTMATKIVVMSRGWVQQIGTPQEIYNNPSNLFVATFIGSPAMNIFDGNVNGDVVTLNDGYSIKLDSSFKAKHQAFYERKVAETKTLIDLIDNDLEDAALRIYDPLEKVLLNNTYNKGGLNKVANAIASKEFERANNLLSTLADEVNDKLQAVEMQNKHEYRESCLSLINEVKDLIAKSAKKFALDEAVNEKLDVLFNLLAEKLDKEFVDGLKQEVVNELNSAKANCELDLNLEASPLDYVKKQLERLVNLFNNHKKANKEALQDTLRKVINALGNEEINQACQECKALLHNYLTITEADLSKIYSAQSYIKNDNKQADVLSYNKKRKNKKVKSAKARKIDPRETRIALLGMLDEYEKALNGEHLLKVGIRPEHIFVDSEFTGKNKTKPFEVTPNVVELLGGELLIHADYNNIDFIAKISSGTLLKAHEKASLAFNGDKVLIFDKTSGERIY